MVKLNKIYTRTGDDGTTGLATGDRVRKDTIRVEAYGTVDESNAFIGHAVIEADRVQGPIGSDLSKLLRSIQHDLFDLGADLATPIAVDESPGSRLRILSAQVDRLEREIDRFNDGLAPLNSFVLPGGTAFAAALHIARTVVRRAERVAVQLLAAESENTSPETVRYLNRLSDLLFVLGRVANNHGAWDVLWTPGTNRPRS